MPSTQNRERTKECVVLVHGLARSHRSMSKMGRILKSDGYGVISSTYPSRKKTIEQLAYPHISRELDKTDGYDVVHFVTHSMGGILLRQYLRENSIESLGRVVMLGPPNKGSEVVDRLHNVPGFKLFNGPAGLQLGTGHDSVPNQLGPATFDVGIIAGTSSINWFLSLLLPGKNDGKVTVERTKLDGMRAHIEMAVTHPLMMRSNLVIRQVQNYLRTGEFNC